MRNNFFRKDLNLSNRWWHRLLVVLFVVLAIYAFYTIVISYPYTLQWKIVNSVEERLTPAVQQIGELKMPNERVEERGRSYGLNSQNDDFLYSDIYCSTDLENRIDEVQNKSGINTLYIREIYNRNDVPIEIFTKYIAQNDIKCLIPDAYTYSENLRVQFLEPIGPDSLFYQDLVFYEKSNFLTVLQVLKMFLLLIGVFLLAIVLYYKVFLYIIFGSKETDI